MGNQNKYTSLMGNTLIFAISTFSAKLMVFLLMPLYTRLLTPSDYAVMDIAVQTANLLMPIVMISISEGVIRYSLDKSIKKSDVFTTGITTALKGFAIFILFTPLLKMYDVISDFTLLIFLYVVSACLRSICSQFVRGIGHVRLYAFDGVLATFTIIVFNIILMVVLKMGVTGYVLSVILSNFCSVLFLEVTAKLHRYLKIGSTNRRVRRQMIAYSLPLIPTTIFWWVMNVSDRYIVNHFMGENITGLYSAAYKIPTIIFLISSIFTQAWQLSAVTEYDQEDKDKFYSKVFSFLTAAIFCAASGIIMLIKPATMILVAPAYYPSWDYAPILVAALVFSCFATFYSSFYMASKKNNMSLITTLFGAALNIILNIYLIPKMGAVGAGVATLISYFAVFVLRAVDTRRFVKLRINTFTMVLNTVAIILQAVSSTIGVEFNWAIQFMLCVFVIMLNLRTLLYAFVSLYEMYRKRMK